MSLIQDVLRWLENVEQRLSTCNTVERHYGETPLTFRVADMGVVRWVERFLAPLLDEVTTPIEDSPCKPLHFHCLYDDQLVTDATRLLIDHGQCIIDEDVGLKGGYRCVYGDGNSLILDPLEGVAIHLDLKQRQFHFIHSTRTRWPTKQFGEMVYEPLMRTAQCHGGIPFHAGAVATRQGAILIVGFGGDGKTTLVSALMREGAAFVGNELSFVKEVNSGFSVFCLADGIHIGIGTALQHPELARLFPLPDDISLPQRKYSRTIVEGYNPSEWPFLKEKISLLSDEFASLLGSPRPQSGLPILGIVRPKVSFRRTPPRIEEIDKSELRNLLRKNAVVLSCHPNWMRWEVPASQPDIPGMAELPAVEFEFYYANGHIHGMEDPLGTLVDSLQ